MSPFFKLVKPTWPLVILPKKKRKKKVPPFHQKYGDANRFLSLGKKKKKAGKAQPLSALKQRAF